MSNELWQATLPHLCAGVLVNRDGVIVRAAPILAWSLGKPLTTLASWIKPKGGTLTQVTPPPRAHDAHQPPL